MLQNSAIWIYYPILFLILDKYFIYVEDVRKCILVLGKKNGVVENITPKKLSIFHTSKCRLSGCIQDRFGRELHRFRYAHVVR